MSSSVPLFEELLQLLGYCFLRRVTLSAGVLACFLRRVALHVVLSAFSFFEGCLACGVAWLVGLLGLLRGGTLSLAFQFL